MIRSNGGHGSGLGSRGARHACQLNRTCYSTETVEKQRRNPLGDCTSTHRSSAGTSMSSQSWQGFPVEPGLHTLELKDRLQEQAMDDTKRASPAALVDCFRKASRRFWHEVVLAWVHGDPLREVRRSAGIAPRRWKEMKRNVREICRSAGARMRGGRQKERHRAQRLAGYTCMMNNKNQRGRADAANSLLQRGTR